MFEIIPIERRNRHVATYDPFREMEEFERRFWGNSSMTTAFRTDVEDTGDAFKLEAELPGFDKEDIQLDLKDGFLTIKAQHKEAQDEKDAQGSYIRRERRLGTFARAFDISGIDEAGITASYTNGILSLTLPKQAPVVPAARQIAIH